MHNRRAGPVLPITAADAAKRSAHSTRKRRIKRSADIVGFGKLLLGILGLGLVVVAIQRTFMKGRGGNLNPADKTVLREEQEQEEEDLEPAPLAQFKSLDYALANSQIVALYFAASWCPQSTPVTKLLDEKLRDILLPPPTKNPPDKLPQRQKLSLVYVSSDENEEQMKGYIQPNWMAVPYDSEERNNLKRHFRTCAKRELEALAMERQYEIPTLVILSGETHQVLAYDGVQDVQESGAEAVDHWLELDRLALALEAKYEKID